MVSSSEGRKIRNILLDISATEDQNTTLHRNVGIPFLSDRESHLRIIFFLL
jgi:hypothetical protein